MTNLYWSLQIQAKGTDVVNTKRHESVVLLPEKCSNEKEKRNWNTSGPFHEKI